MGVDVDVDVDVDVKGVGTSDALVSRGRGRGREDSSLTSGTSIVLCTMFKNEAPYLEEWLEYHRLLGVSKVSHQSIIQSFDPMESLSIIR